MAQQVYANHAENAFYYNLFCFLAFACYPVGVYYHETNRKLLGTYIHILLHLFANLANVLLYSGHIPVEFPLL